MFSVLSRPSLHSVACCMLGDHTRTDATERRAGLFTHRTLVTSANRVVAPLAAMGRWLGCGRTNADQLLCTPLQDLQCKLGSWKLAEKQVRIYLGSVLIRGDWSCWEKHSCGWPRLSLWFGCESCGEIPVTVCKPEYCCPSVLWNNN